MWRHASSPSSALATRQGASPKSAWLCLERNRPFELNHDRRDKNHPHDLLTKRSLAGMQLSNTSPTLEFNFRPAISLESDEGVRNF
jgi:hypothetical protein